MAEGLAFDDLLQSMQTTGVLPVPDTAASDRALDHIRLEFDASADPFEHHRSICAQIGATEDPGLRSMLMHLRDAFMERLISVAIAEIEEAFGRSAEDGWKAWLKQLGASLVASHMRHAMRLCAHPFPFEDGRASQVRDIARTVESIRQSRWEEAYEGLELLAHEDAVAVASRARLLTLVGQIEMWRFDLSSRAKERFTDAQRMAPEDVFVLATLGDYWLREKDASQAASYYRNAIKIAPKDASGYVGMGDCAEKNPQLDQRAQVEQAEWWYREAIARAGGDSIGYRRLVRLLGRSSLLKQREDEVLRLVQTNIAVDPEGEFETYQDLGQWYSSAQDFATARRWYDKAVALEDRWPLGYTALAELCHVEGNVSEAERFCRMAIDVAPECPSGYLLLARHQEQRSQWADALKLYEALPPRPKQWASFARASAGRMHAKLGNVARAEQVLRSELQASPRAPYAKAAFEDLAVDFYRNRHDAASARRIYDELLQTLGDQYQATYHNQLGNMHYAEAEYESAIAEYQQAIAASPRDAVFHRNLSAAFSFAGDFERAERALDAAYEIDRDEAKRKQEQSALANLQGNQAYEKGAFEEAARWYTKAIDLSPSHAVYHTNLAGAWERTMNAATRVFALEQAIRCYERAQEITKTRNYAGWIDRLRWRIAVARTYGDKLIDQMLLVTPIAVEVAPDLILSVEGSAKDALSEELAASVDRMRNRVSAELGVRVPGIRFRGNETDLPDGTYVVMINETPRVSGSLALDRRFFAGDAEVLSRVNLTGEPASDPVSGQAGFWIERRDWETAKRKGLALWTITEYLMRHVEAVVRRNITEFVGHQEIVGLLDAEAGSLAGEIRASSPTLTALTTVCRALLAEEVPIQPFQPLCAAFTELHANGTSLREIVEGVRRRSPFRERLPGNDPSRSVLKLSAGFEAQIRESLYDDERRLTLAMPPEVCQEALAAVRSRVQKRGQTLLVDDATLRPFVRKLVELEFPDLPVLASTELAHAPEIGPSSIIGLDSEPPIAPISFRARHRAPLVARTETLGQPSEDATRSIRIEVSISRELEMDRSTADDRPLNEMFGIMNDGLFYELGITLPPVQLSVDDQLKPTEFRIRLNGADEQLGSGLAPNHVLVNDTVDRLTLLGITGQEAVNPANGAECAIVQYSNHTDEICRQAGLTTWGPPGFLVLSLSAAIRTAAAEFQTNDVTRYNLDRLSDAFPDLVRVVLQRYTVQQLTAVLRELLVEEISIRDLRDVLECLLSIDGTTDVDLDQLIVFMANTDALCPASAGQTVAGLMPSQLADFVRAGLRWYLSHKYTRGDSTLVVYLVDREIEERIAEFGTHPLTSTERERLHDAIRAELQALPLTAHAPVVLTTFQIRRTLRNLIAGEFPRLAVVSYQELAPDLNIQPIARISW